MALSEIIAQINLYLGMVPYSMEIIQTIVVLIVAKIIDTKVIDRWLVNFAKRAKIKEHYLKPLENLTSFFVYLVALFLILGIFNLTGSLTSLLAGAGFAGIVVGFAAKDIIGNFISGVVLILDQPYRVGDVVKIKEVFGKVIDISIRATQIRTFDGEVVTVPNSMGVNEIITNRTLDNMNFRINFNIGVDYDNDIDKVIGICKEVLESIEEIKEEPSPEVVFDKFDSSSVNFILRFWINMEEIGPPAIKTKVSDKLKKRFKEEGIGIPFPHREILQHGKWKAE